MRKQQARLTRKASSDYQYATQRRYAPTVATLPWISLVGVAGFVDWVAGLPWIEWQPSHGLGGRNLEYAFMRL